MMIDIIHIIINDNKSSRSNQIRQVDESNQVESDQIN